MKLFVTIQLYLLVLLANSVSAQSKADSLQNLLLNTLNDSTYIDLLNKLSKEYRYSDPQLAMNYAVKAEKVSINSSNNEGLSLAYHNIAAIYADKQNNELALKYNFKSLRISESVGDKVAMANSYGNIGLIYNRQNLYELALEFHNKSLKLKTEIADSIGMAYAIGNIGLVYSQQGKYDKALINFYNALRMKEAQNDKYGIANAHGNIGIVYLKIGGVDQAKVNLEKCLEIFEELNNLSGIAEALLYLGGIYMEQNDYDAASESFNRCLSIYINKENTKGMADAYLKLGHLYYKLGKPQLALQNFKNSYNFYIKNSNNLGIVTSSIELARYYLDHGSTAESSKYLNKAYKMACDNNFITEKNTVLQLKARLAYKNDEFAKAADFLLLAKNISDTLFNQKLINEVAKVQMQYEYDKKIKEREFTETRARLEQQLKMQHLKNTRTFAIIFIGLLIIVIIVLLRVSDVIKIKNKLLLEQKKQISEQMASLYEQQSKQIKANQTKDKFISIIGHDLRNPINAINGFVNLITEQSTSGNSELLTKYLKMLKEAGNNAQNLLENLLEWALTQSGELKVKLSDVKLNNILRGNVLLIKEQADQKAITLNLQLTADPVVFIDKNMINTVVRNLLSNALKYTNAGGFITLKTEVFLTYVTITITDTGIGMSAQQLIDIFNPAIIKKRPDGLATPGLGLMLCKEFLGEHQQELSVKSVLNQGTSFWFSLPLSENRPA